MAENKKQRSSDRTESCLYFLTRHGPGLSREAVLFVLQATIRVTKMTQHICTQVLVYSINSVFIVLTYGSVQESTTVTLYFPKRGLGYGFSIRRTSHSIARYLHGRRWAYIVSLLHREDQFCAALPQDPNWKYALEHRQGAYHCRYGLRRNHVFVMSFQGSL